MGVESFIPQQWSGNLLTRLHENLIISSLCNRDYEGEVSQSGDRVRVNMVSGQSASAYTPNSTTLTYGQLDGAPVYVDINRRYYAAFYIDDLDKRQAKGDVVGEGTKELGFALAKEMEVYIASLYGQAQVVAGLGTEAAPIDVTSLNVTEYLGLVAQGLDNANVPTEGRWFVCRPWFLHKIELADITLNTNNTTTVQNGFRGNYLGFNIFVSNNISRNSSSNDKTRNLAGYMGSITLAQQIPLTVEAMRDPINAFRDLVRALNVYGAKVIRPDTLACLRADYTAEP